MAGTITQPMASETKDRKGRLIKFIDESFNFVAILKAVADFKPKVRTSKSLAKDVEVFLGELESSLGKIDYADLCSQVDEIVDEIEAEAEKEIDGADEAAAQEYKGIRAEIAETLLSIMDRSPDAILQDRVNVFSEQLRNSHEWNSSDAEANVCSLFPQ